MLKSAVAAACATALLATTAASAAEVSFVSGLYRSEKVKVDGNDAGKKSAIEVGGRFSDALDNDWHWFGQGLLTMRSYSGSNAPSDSTSLSVGGGMRYYFSRFGESAV